MAEGKTLGSKCFWGRGRKGKVEGCLLVEGARREGPAAPMVMGSVLLLCIVHCVWVGGIRWLCFPERRYREFQCSGPRDDSRVVDGAHLKRGNDVAYSFALSLCAHMKGLLVSWVTRWSDA